MKNRFIKNCISSSGFALMLAIMIIGQVAVATASTPLFTGCPEYVRGGHCDSLYYQVAAIDTSSSGNRNNVRYQLVSGPGYINERTGLWVFRPDIDSAAVGKSLIVEISASIGSDTTNSEDNCRFNSYSLNSSPLISNCGQTFEMEAGETLESWYYLGDPDDCDSAILLSYKFGPEPVGEFSFDSTTRHSIFTPAPEDNNKVFVISFTFSDGFKTVGCSNSFTVGEPPPFAMRIEKIKNALQGRISDVSIIVDEQPVGIGGFSLLVAYDASAMTFQGAQPGEALYSDCSWEYFTYRYGANGNCSDGCPTGLISLTGIAETNNGPNHPSCYLSPTPYELAQLTFIISNDRNRECSFIPIQFYWVDCTDNTLTDQNGQTLFIANTVKDFDYDSTGIEDIGPPTSLPSYLGVTGICDNGSRREVSSFIDFYNGGVGVVCADSIDDRCLIGDVTFDGQIDSSDLALYADLMTTGIVNMSHCGNSCVYNYSSCTEATLAVSDINLNSFGLEVADFLLLLNIITGKLPDSTCSEGLCVSSEQGFAVLNWWNGIVMDVPEPVGAIALRIMRSVEPSLVNADGFEMIYRFDGNHTKCFIYSPEGLAWPDSASVRWEGSGYLEEVRAATYQGVTIPIIIQGPTDIEDNAGEALPQSFALHQNYPNPFNPATKISFDLVVGSDIKLELFDIRGRSVVVLHEGNLSAGTHEIEWNGRDSGGNRVASGVYLYRLTSGNFVASKKMLLLK